MCTLKDRFSRVNPEVLKSCAFSPDVWRVCMGRFPASFIDLTTNHAPCRAPLPSEMPSRRWLAYGSSITNGASPTGHHLAYVYHAARQLRADVYNMGLSGALPLPAGNRRLFRRARRLGHYLAGDRREHARRMQRGSLSRSGWLPDRSGVEGAPAKARRRHLDLSQRRLRAIRHANRQRRRDEAGCLQRRLGADIVAGSPKKCPSPRRRQHPGRVS